MNTRPVKVYSVCIGVFILYITSKSHRPLLPGNEACCLEIFPFLLFLQVQPSIPFPSAVADPRGDPSSPYSPFQRDRISRSQPYPLLSSSLGTLQMPSLSSFLRVYSRDTEFKKFNLELPVPTAIKSKENCLPANTQMSHSKNLERKQKSRNKTPTQQRQFEKPETIPIIPNA